jgi:hypothetical protein
MGFSIEDVNKLTFKVQAGGVIDANTGSRWYESWKAFSPKVLPERILTNYNLIPTANTPAIAQSNASADPTNIQDLSAASAAKRVSIVQTGKNNSWIVYDTYNTPSSGVLQNWIAPPSIPQSTGAPSDGYKITLWSGDPTGAAGSFKQVFTSAEQVGGSGFVGWVFNYDMGLLFLADDLVTAIQGNSGGNYPGGLDLYINGFRYVGATGGGGAGGSQGATGFTGNQGATGNQGLTGNQGDTGFTGNQGATGNQGDTGNQGLTGFQGNTGFTGNQGATGNQGLTGNQGITGATGATGFQGTTGFTGNQGDTGNQGLTGFQGNTGFTGNQGATGNQGDTGNQGLTGFQGNTGFTGNQGATGNQGVIGQQGATGYQGDTGNQG